MYADRTYGTSTVQLPTAPDRLTMSSTTQLPAEAMPIELVLAAIERADRHRARDSHDVPIWVIAEHLDIPTRSAAARRVRAQIDAMQSAGLLERSRRRGVLTWALTDAGRERLRRAVRAGDVPELPESPQHRAWRNARALAAHELAGFREGVHESLDAALRLLELDPPASSDQLLDTAEQLRRRMWRVASATYCLREWAEPDDARADESPRYGLRNTWLWGGDAW